MAAVKSGITYVDYTDEAMLQEIQVLVAKDLSEPYSVFTYRYFLHKWPSLCVCVYSEVGEKAERGEMIAAIVCKADNERGLMKGYIAMLAVSKSHRNRGIGLKLAHIGIERMIAMGCEEISLEAESTNLGALALYEKLGFARDEKLARYYLNGGDAYRLILWVKPNETDEIGDMEGANIISASESR